MLVGERKLRKLAIAVFLLFCFLPCYAAKKSTIRWEIYAKDHVAILQGLVGIEFSSVPKDAVFEIYKHPDIIKKVSGAYDSASRKIWVKDYESALHEVGHFIWHEKLSSYRWNQWEKWFNETKIFPSLRSSVNVREFFAEHYRFFIIGEVALKISYYGSEITRGYNRVFLDQFVWFTNVVEEIK